MSHSSENRWTLFRRPRSTTWWLAPAGSRTDLDPDLTIVEVMPVAEHKAVLDKIADQIDRTGRVDWMTI